MLIEGETGRVLGLAALVYMLPLVLFFIGYAIGNAARRRCGGALAGGMLFALGIIGAIFYSRRMKQNGEVRSRSRTGCKKRNYAETGRMISVFVL